MTRWKMFIEIQQLKELGLKKTQVADRLKINRKTVNKYWDCAPEQYAETVARSSTRVRKLDPYEDMIVSWLRAHPDLSAAQIEDWLKEQTSNLTVKERAIRSYISSLRTKYDIPKPKRYREYVAVPDPPMGQQLQIDFGEIKVSKVEGGKTKLYALGSVLAHSRQKYGEWSQQPLTTNALIGMLVNCFRFYGGIPREIVIDQDKLMVVSENYGDIIFTRQFEQFRQKTGFRIHLCRAGDPESKGRIEAVIKYLKYGFAQHRTFTDLASWNRSCSEWLGRTANRKVHGTTKKVPAEVFALEKQHLQPVPSFRPLPTDSVTRSVRKDNTILFKSNRYSVPKGTFGRKNQVQIVTQENQLLIADLDTGECLAQHPIEPGKGQLIQSANHLRDYTEKMDVLYAQVTTALEHISDAQPFLHRIKEEKRRYIRDQIKLVLQLQQAYSSDLLQQGIHFCHENQLYSAVDLRDTLQHLASQAPDSISKSILGAETLPENLRIRAATRDIHVYTALVEAGEAL